MVRVLFSRRRECDHFRPSVQWVPNVYAQHDASVWIEILIGVNEMTVWRSSGSPAGLTVAHSGVVNWPERVVI